MTYSWIGSSLGLPHPGSWQTDLRSVDAATAIWDCCWKSTRLAPSHARPPRSSSRLTNLCFALGPGRESALLLDTSPSLLNDRASADGRTSAGGWRGASRTPDFYRAPCGTGRPRRTEAGATRMGLGRARLPSARHSDLRRTDLPRRRSRSPSRLPTMPASGTESAHTGGCRSNGLDDRPRTAYGLHRNKG